MVTIQVNTKLTVDNRLETVPYTYANTDTFILLLFFLYFFNFCDNDVKVKRLNTYNGYTIISIYMRGIIDVSKPLE